MLSGLILLIIVLTSFLKCKLYCTAFKVVINLQIKIPNFRYKGDWNLYEGFKKLIKKVIIHKIVIIHGCSVQTLSGFSSIPGQSPFNASEVKREPLSGSNSKLCSQAFALHCPLKTPSFLPNPRGNGQRLSPDERYGVSFWTVKSAPEEIDSCSPPWLRTQSWGRMLLSKEGIHTHASVAMELHLAVQCFGRIMEKREVLVHNIHQGYRPQSNLLSFCSSSWCLVNRDKANLKFGGEVLPD